MKIRSPEPMIMLCWPEYKKRTVFSRFPLAFLCGILALVFSIGILYDAVMNKKATDEPISVGLTVVENSYIETE